MTLPPPSLPQTPPVIPPSASPLILEILLPGVIGVYGLLVQARLAG